MNSDEEVIMNSDEEVIMNSDELIKQSRFMNATHSVEINQLVLQAYKYGYDNGVEYAIKTVYKVLKSDQPETDTPITTTEAEREET